MRLAVGYTASILRLFSVLNSADKVEIDLNLLGVIFLLPWLAALINNDFFDKLSHEFGRQLPNISVLFHDFQKAVGVEQLILLGVDFCLCGRFMAFTALYQDYMLYYLLTGTAIAPTKNGKADFEAIDKMELADKKEQLAAIDKLNPKGANIVSFTILQSLNEFLYFEFTELLKQGLRVRKCRNCGRYFVLKSKHETFYCDRTAENGLTCKAIGNKAEYLKKLAEDAPLLDYERIYKAHYAKMMRDEAKEMPADDKIGAARKAFTFWAETAKETRQQYVAGGISETEFAKKLELQ